MQVKTVRVDDIDVAYQVHGKEEPGTPLVLIMGYGCTMDIWPPAFVDRLVARRRVLLFDHRGMGLSTGSEKEITIELLADDAARLLKTLGLSRAHFLGWSMGAMVAQEVALRHPAAVGKLVLYAGHCGGKDALKPDKKIWSMLTDISGTLEERIDRMFHLLFPASWHEEHPDRSSYFPPFTEPVEDESIVAQARAMARWAGTCDRLRDMKQSTLVITGTEDVVIPPGNASILAGKIPGASVVRIKGGGHGAMYQRPLEFAEAVEDFLED